MISLPHAPSTGKHQQQQQQQQHAAMQVASNNPRLNQLCSRWQQVWLLALDRQRKLNDALDRLEEVPFNFDMYSVTHSWSNVDKKYI